MDNIISTSPAPQTTAEYEHAVDLLLEQLREMNLAMERDREDINRLKTHTAALQAETRAILTSMGAKF